MHAHPLLYPTPCMASPYFISPHTHPPPYSIPLPAWPHPIPRRCTPSSYSIPAHANPPPILFHPMHALSLFYPTPCMPSPYSIPAHACPLCILSHLKHALLLILSLPTCATPVYYSIFLVQVWLRPEVLHTQGSNSWPPDHDSISHDTEMPALTTLPSVTSYHAYPSNSLSHTCWRHVPPLTSQNAAFGICSSAHIEYIFHHLHCSVIWSINS